MMSTGAGFQSDLGRLHFSKKGFNLPPPRLAPEGDAVLFVDAM